MPDPELDYADPGGFDDFEPLRFNESSRILRASSGVAAEEEEAAEDEDEVAGEEEEAAEVEQTITVRPDKGKRRAEPMEEDEQSNTGLYDTNGVEDDIAQGLEEVENAQNDEDNVPLAKKPRKDPAKSRKPRPEKRVVRAPAERAYCASPLCISTQTIAGSPTPEGVRRGRRHRFKPLEWWRQEKVVYGRRDSGAILVPQIKEIVRVPQEPVKPLGKAGKRKRGTTVTRGKSKGRDTPFNPEEGWDEQTPMEAVVLDFDTQEELTRRRHRIKAEHHQKANVKICPGVAYLARKINPNVAANSSWLFQKIFADGEFVAAGQIHIPVGSQKPSKSSKDNTYVRGAFVLLGSREIPAFA